jgi:hypothetical protein
LSEPSNLERRLRRLALLVPMFAAIGAVFGMIPRGLGIEVHSWGNKVPFMSDRTMNAGGWSLVAWAAVQLLIAASVRANPTRKVGWWWFGGSIVLCAGGGVAWYAEHFVMWDRHVPNWPGHVTALCGGAAVVLVLVALPSVLLVTERTPPATPTARVVKK